MHAVMQLYAVSKKLFVQAIDIVSIALFTTIESHKTLASQLCHQAVSPTLMGKAISVRQHSILGLLTMTACAACKIGFV